MPHTWRNSFSSLDISNLFIYVGDAVRWDYGPEILLDRGMCCKTIAASIHSPTSFASLVTGRHPPKHGVYAFTNQLDGSVDSLFDVPNMETRFVNSVRDKPSGKDPIFSVLNIESPTESNPFEGISEPFIVMERGPGGHAPYGESDETAWEYFERRRRASAATFTQEYRESVEADSIRFFERLDDLSKAGLREDTLVVYTSDHGELLGEDGLLGHNAPMRPELIEVPTVFIHPELQNLSINRGVFRHIDLLPTLLDILDGPDWETDGISILTDGIAEHGLSFYQRQFPTGRIPGFSGILGYDGYWERNGGYVFPHGSRRDRFAVLLGKAIKSPKRGYLRRHFVSATRSYIAGNRTFGFPARGISSVKSEIEKIRYDQTTTADVALSEDAKKQLQDLGYL